MVRQELVASAQRGHSKAAARQIGSYERPFTLKMVKSDLFVHFRHSETNQRAVRMEV